MNKPCPFCGGKSKLRKETRDTALTLFYIRCADCNCRTPATYRERGAKQIWNARTVENSS